MLPRMTNDEVFQLITDNQLELQTWLLLFKTALFVYPEKKEEIIENFSKSVAIKLTRDDINKAETKQRIANAIKLGVKNYKSEDFAETLKGFIANQSYLQNYPCNAILDIIISGALELKKYNFNISAMPSLKKSSLYEYIDLRQFTNAKLLEVITIRFTRFNAPINYKTKRELTDFYNKNKNTTDALRLWAAKTYRERLEKDKEEIASRSKSAQEDIRKLSLYYPLIFTFLLTTLVFYSLYQFNLLRFIFVEFNTAFSSYVLTALFAIIVAIATLKIANLRKSVTEIRHTHYVNELVEQYLNEVTNVYKDARELIARSLAINFIEFDDDELAMGNLFEIEEYPVAVPSKTPIDHQEKSTHRIIKQRLLGQNIEDNDAEKEKVNHSSANYVDEFTEYKERYERKIIKGFVATQLVLRREIERDIPDNKWINYLSIFKNGRVGGERGKCIKFLPRHPLYSAEIKDNSDMRIFSVRDENKHVFKHYGKALH